MSTHAGGARHAMLAALLAALACTLAPAAARAAWPVNGVRVSSISDNQRHPAVAPDNVGGMYVVWSDFNYFPISRDIYAQHINSSGTLLWGANGIAVCSESGLQDEPLAISDGSGGVIIAWNDYRYGPRDVRAQRVDFTGVAMWLAGGVTIGSSDSLAAIVPDGAGGALIGMEHTYAAEDIDLYCQRVTSGGSIAPGFASGTGNVICTAGGIQRHLRMTPDGANGAVMCWGDRRSGAVGGEDIYALRMQWDGTVPSGWTSGGNVVCNALNGQVDPDITTDGTPAGRYDIVWADGRTGGNSVYGQRLDPFGGEQWTANGLALVADSYQNVQPRIVSSTYSGTVVCWQQLQPSGNYILFAKGLQADGSLGSYWPSYGRQLFGYAFDKANVDVVSDGYLGLFAVQGHDFLTPRFGDVLAQHATGLNGNNAYAITGVAACSANGEQFEIAVSRSSDEAPLLAWRDERTAGDVIYAIRLQSYTDIDQTVFPGGWTSPVIPRNAAGGTLGSTLLTATLPGNSASTWLNWATDLPGPYATPAFRVGILLDEEDLLAFASIPDGYGPGVSVRVNDVGPAVIRGGRHSLRALADDLTEVQESNEVNNDWADQWAWSPALLLPALPLERALPPARGPGFFPNSDGFQFSHPSSYAWVVGAGARNAADDYDFIVDSDYSGSTSGFQTQMAGSFLGGGHTDFVVGHYTVTATVFPTVIRFSTGPRDSVWVDANNASGRNSGSTPATYTGQILPPGRLVDIYEGNLVSGTTYYFGLHRTAGAADMRFAVYPATSGSVNGRSGALASSTPVGSEWATATFVPPISGWYPIVAYRDNGEQANEKEIYTLKWDTSAIAAVGPGPGTYALAFAPAKPNPAHGEAVFAFTLSHEGEARLDIFDVSGRLVAAPVAGPFGPGPHEARWYARGTDGASLAAGLYFARLRAEGREFVQRISVVP